jgi:uncharacterized iron-regulated membrane protein
MGERALTLRQAAIVVHRYVGLVLAVFLLIAGLTGTLLVFYTELDRLVAAPLQVVDPPFPGAPVLDPFELADRVEAALPGADASASFSLEPGTAASIWIEVSPGEWREAFVDPYTGRVLGRRNWGDLREGTVNLMPFLFRLHYTLALGEVGTLLFGVVALLWTIDCFVGAYLTFPLPERRQRARPGVWLRRWAPAWLVKTNRLFSFVFTWHRASGLWLWALLLVFAWSAVGLNLGPVYRPVMQATFGQVDSIHDSLPELPHPHPKPKLTLREAHLVGRRLMADQARARGFDVVREEYLYHAGDHDAYVYAVLSSLDVSQKYPRTEVYFSAQDGHLIGFDAATGIAAGNTITSWINGLHFAIVGGFWYRMVVVFVGLAVATLSATGVWVWWVKRKRRASRSFGTAGVPVTDP